MDKELKEYFKAKEILANKRLVLAQKLLEKQPFAKHFELYVNGDKITISRINDYKDENLSLKHWIGPVTSVAFLTSEGQFERDFLYVLDRYVSAEPYKSELGPWEV